MQTFPTLANTTHPSQRYVCADGSVRHTKAKISGVSATAARVFNSRGEGGIASNYPWGLQELHEAECDPRGYFNPIVKKETQNQLVAQALAKAPYGGMSQHEKDALKAAREQRKHDDCDGLPSRKQRRFTRLRNVSAN